MLPIRVLHFADVHIGMENYGKSDPETGLSTRVRDFLRRLDEMIDYVGRNGVDLVIFAGDAFKTRTPNPTYQREFAHRIRDLSQAAPVVMLVGNHDLPPSAQKASSIEIYDTLAVPNVWVAHDYETREVSTERGSVVVGAAPYPIRSRLLEALPNALGLTISETDQQLRKAMTQILDDLAAQADKIAHHSAEGDLPRLLTGHFTVQGAVYGSERNVMLGRDVEVLLSSLADTRWDYVALGHIHKHQNLTVGRSDVPPVVYSGSMERIDFGEGADPKGFCYVELERGRAVWRFIELAARPFITLREDLRDSTNPTDTVIRLIEQHNLVGAVVRLLLTFSKESESRFNEERVREALKRAGAHHVGSIRKEIEQVARARLGGSPEGMTHLQLLERYLISREIDEDRRNELMQAAQEIFAATQKEE